MGQQSLIGVVTMKCFVVLALALAAASAIHIPKKYEHYKPGYMRIPGWEDIASGKRKLNQKESTKVFISRSDTIVKAACGVPGPMGDSGGPLSIPGSNYEQIGVVSFGSTLGCESGAPAGFTEVSMYRSWISSVTGIKLE